MCPQRKLPPLRSDVPLFAFCFVTALTMISLQSVSKRFKLYHRPVDRVLEWCQLGKRHDEFYALRDVNLEVPRARTVGIVGANGAGKSTLLKLITGTLIPTTGMIEIQGRIAALLELGTGFHPDFTGRQNIYINGQLLGMSHEEIRDVEQEIIDFSELGRFIEQPLRTYSSGMVVRLGFSIAASVNPEVLIVDEALSVGDARFSQKCVRRIQQFRDHGTTILFVSHDSSAVAALCDEAILLEAGQVRSRGVPRDILAEYNALLAAKGAGNLEMRVTKFSDGGENKPRHHGTYQALVTGLEMTGPDGRPTEIFHPGDTMLLRLRICFLVPVKEPSIGFLIKDRLGLNLYGTNTVLKKLKLPSRETGETIELEARVPINLGYGTYNITVAVHDDETHLQACYEWIDNAAFFQVQHREKPDWSGLTLLEPELEYQKGTFSAREIAGALENRFDEITDPLPASMNLPSPFLKGFGPIEYAEGGDTRAMDGKATFVFRPSARRLVLACTAEGGGPVEYTLTISGISDDLVARQQEGEERVAFALPEECVGRAGLFTIEVQGEKKVQLREIRSEGSTGISPPRS